MWVDRLGGRSGVRIEELGGEVDVVDVGGGADSGWVEKAIAI